MKDFKAFLNQGNVMGLAVGVIIGAAFGTIVKSLTDDVLMPFIGFITGGGVDFTNKYLVLSGGEKVTTGMTLAAANATGANVMALGSFAFNWLVKSGRRAAKKLTGKIVEVVEEEATLRDNLSHASATTDKDREQQPENA